MSDFKQRALYITVVALTVLLRSEYEIRFNDLMPDKALQLTAAKNFFEGKNISRCEVTTSDLSTDKYMPFASWPFGYPLVVTLAALGTGDFLRASIVVDIVAVTLLVLASVGLLRALGVTGKWQLAWLVFLAFAQSPFIYTTSSGLIALALYVAAMLHATQILSRANVALHSWLCLGALLFLPCFFRYAYYPMVIPIPLVLLWVGWRTRQWKIVTGTLIAVACVGLLVALQSVFVKSITSDYSCLSNTERGLFLNHLGHIDPFPVKAVLLTGPLRRALAGLPCGPRVFSFFMVTGSFVLPGILLLRAFGEKVWRAASVDEGETLWKAFVLTGLLTVLVNVAALMLLSVTYPPQTDWTTFWTFVQETRYYAPAMFVILLFLFAFASRETGSKELRVLIALLTVIAFTFSVYAHAKLYVLGNTEGTFRQENETRLRIAEYVAESIQETGRRVVLAGRDGIAIRLSQLRDGYGTQRLDTILGGDLPHSRPLRLMLRLDGADAENHGSWLEAHHALLIEDFGGSTLYRVDLD